MENLLKQNEKIQPQFERVNQRVLDGSQIKQGARKSNDLTKGPRDFLSIDQRNRFQSKTVYGDTFTEAIDSKSPTKKQLKKPYGEEDVAL